MNRSVTAETFDGFSPGTVITMLPGIRRTSVTSLVGYPIDLRVYSDEALPVPVLAGGRTASPPNLLAPTPSNPSHYYYRPGGLYLTFNKPRAALGVHLYSRSGVVQFRLILAGTLVGTRWANEPRTPTDSFFGVVANGTLTFDTAIVEPKYDEPWAVDNLIHAAPCYADCTRDAQLDVQDFTCFQNAFAIGDASRADCTEDNRLDIADFTCFQNEFALGCVFPPKPPVPPPPPPGPIMGVVIGTFPPPSSFPGVCSLTRFPLEPFHGPPPYVPTTSISSPLGGPPLLLSPTHGEARIGQGWATWSHGYTGDIWWSQGATSTTYTMPPGTRGFVIYAEPNPFVFHKITAVARNGNQTSTITQDVDGEGGACGFGFYSATIDILTIDLSSDADYAVGEFSICK